MAILSTIKSIFDPPARGPVQNDWTHGPTSKISPDVAQHREALIENRQVVLVMSPVKEPAMSELDPRPEVSTIDLVKETVVEAQQLFKAEIALAREEANRQLQDAKRVVIVMSAGGVMAILGLSMLLVALVLAIAPHALTALITGIVLLIGAGIAGFIGYQSIPKKPLAQTQERLQEDAQVLKERLT
jgi:uncharacterized membrane protein YqjE